MPEGVLFQNSNAFVKVKQDLIENYNLECVLSLPSGVFLPYSAVKTNVLFFSKGLRGIVDEQDSNVYYYELIPPYKLTKNKPLEYAHFKEFLECYKQRKITPHSYLVSLEELKARNYDLSAKNPNTKEEKSLREVGAILESLKNTQQQAEAILQDLNGIINHK